jgi:hypothetical protein
VPIPAPGEDTCKEVPVRMRTMIAAVGLALALPSVAAEKEPYVGTWKLDVAKSGKDPGPGLRSATDVNTTTPDGAMTSDQNWVDADGKAGQSKWMARFDGKDYPVVGGAPGTTISLKRPDPKKPGVVDWVFKVPGQYTSVGRVVYDGNTRVNEFTMTDASGKKKAFRRYYTR